MMKIKQLKRKRDLRKFLRLENCIHTLNEK